MSEERVSEDMLRVCAHSPHGVTSLERSMARELLSLRALPATRVAEARVAEADALLYGAFAVYYDCPHSADDHKEAWCEHYQEVREAFEAARDLRLSRATSAPPDEWECGPPLPDVPGAKLGMSNPPAYVGPKGGDATRHHSISTTPGSEGSTLPSNAGGGGDSAAAAPLEQAEDALVCALDHWTDRGDGSSSTAAHFMCEELVRALDATGFAIVRKDAPRATPACASPAHRAAVELAQYLSGLPSQREQRLGSHDRMTLFCEYGDYLRLLDFYRTARDAARSAGGAESDEAEMSDLKEHHALQAALSDSLGPANGASIMEKLDEYTRKRFAALAARKEGA